MSEPAPATPVAEPTTPTAPAPEEAPASAPEQPAQAPETAPTEGANNYFTNEQLAEMQRMFENNGGFEKTWGRMKDSISRPQAVTQPEAPQAPSAPQPTQESVQAPEAPQAARHFHQVLLGRPARGRGQEIQVFFIVHSFPPSAA